ncbi:CDP-glycerol glycerophosphotransferase family protein [Cellulosimicrobium marinum]|uniref:CDP-glycerol glycerophosphotransferase family protein n=1 Tax=Cellulosimicrobium marinum TaxID=1638992 RepID=UPI001E41378B|nr:CDP-glycerol glycerophosphotransferase family protein [Cellulosimicrobium marinum]MCB7137191.1 CDP-glycerol glycerophosphotransferase family protein [Cellulosimicrobium marinum]
MNALVDTVRTIWPTLRTVLVNLVAATALVVAATATPDAWAGALVVAGVLSIAWVLRTRIARPTPGLLGTYGAARILLAAAVTVLAARDPGDWPAVVAGALVALTVAVEAVVARSWRQVGRLVRGVPGGPAMPRSARLGPWQVAFSLAAAALLAGTPWLPAPVLVLLLVAILVVAGAEAVSVLTAPRVRARRERELRAALEAYAPQVMLYITGPGGTEYQLAAWASVLERIDARTVVVAREHALAEAAARTTSLPVVASPSLAELDALHVPSFRVALYVNNGAKNTHNVRYQDMTHVQLLHGDSDKPASYNPVTAMFDKIFVAGQAGIDRYANHGVRIPLDKFEIVGRPQVVGIERPVVRRPATTALYAPTWTGFQADANYGSLPVGTEIVRALIDHGLTVTFRPHPYSAGQPSSAQQISEIEELLATDAASSGRAHVFGEAASAGRTLQECFNEADVLVTDVSSVPADFLFSEKPFVILKMQPGSTAEFLAEFPLARAGYLAHGSDPSTIGAAVRSAVGDDPLAETRKELRTYYLGDLPYEGYEQTFHTAIRVLVAAGPRAAAAPSSDTLGPTDLDMPVAVDERTADEF